MTRIVLAGLICLLLCLYMTAHTYFIQTYVPKIIQTLLNQQMEPTHPLMLLISLLNMDFMILFIYLAILVIQWMNN